MKQYFVMVSLCLFLNQTNSLDVDEECQKAFKNMLVTISKIYKNQNDQKIIDPLFENLLENTQKAKESCKDAITQVDKINQIGEMGEQIYKNKDRNLNSIKMKLIRYMNEQSQSPVA